MEAAESFYFKKNFWIKTSISGIVPHSQPVRLKKSSKFEFLK